MDGLNEKATIPMSSALTDAEQSSTQSYVESITENKINFNKDKNLKEKSPNYLHTVSMSELYDTVYPSKLPVIENLLYAGTYLFVGAPKVGKSFFMAQLAYHVSEGIPLWEYPVNKGDVLYMALEDDYARLQKRLSQMFGMESSDHLHFATCAKQLGGGLEGQLKEFLKNYPNTKLVIIDTLQKIREAGRDKLSYGSDYEVVTKLKNFSDTNGICLLIVHHTRKQSSEDCFDTISGTNGLLGSADGAFILQKEKRTGNSAILDAVGRDQQDQRLHIAFDRERCIWKLTKAETELIKPPLDPLLEELAKLVTIESPDWNGSASELAEQLQGIELQPNALTRRLNVGANQLLNEYGIHYENTRSHIGRQVRLYLE